MDGYSIYITKSVKFIYFSLVDIEQQIMPKKEKKISTIQKEKKKATNNINLISAH